MAALYLNQQQTRGTRGTESDQENHSETGMNKFIGNQTLIGQVSLADRYLYAAIITKRENNETKTKTNKSAEAALQGRSRRTKRKRDE